MTINKSSFISINLFTKRSSGGLLKKFFKYSRVMNIRVCCSLTSMRHIGNQKSRRIIVVTRHAIWLRNKIKHKAISVLQITIKCINQEQANKNRHEKNRGRMLNSWLTKQWLAARILHKYSPHRKKSKWQESKKPLNKLNYTK